MAAPPPTRPRRMLTEDGRVIVGTGIDDRLERAPLRRHVEPQSGTGGIRDSFDQEPSPPPRIRRQVIREQPPTECECACLHELTFTGAFCSRCSRPVT
jgi:hypothetical protein